MSQGHNFISGVVMLVVAGTLVFVVTREDEPLAAGTEAYAPEKRPGDWGAELKRPRTESRTARPDVGSKWHGVPQASAAMEGRLPKAGQLRSDLRVQVDRAGDLEERAQRVEAFAMRRLGMLTEQLDLTAAQQARIFPILVRGSQSYDPRMRVVSGSQARAVTDDPASAPVDKSQEQALLQHELSASQSQELADQTIHDLLIWEEIIDGLANQLDQATPGQVDEVADGGTGAGTGTGVEVPAEGESAPAVEPVVPLESHGGRNLFGP